MTSSASWRVDRAADYGPLDRLAAHRINLALIAEHWDDLLGIAGSLKLGTIRASALVRSLHAASRATAALVELGAVAFLFWRPADNVGLDSAVSWGGSRS